MSRDAMQQAFDVLVDIEDHIAKPYSTMVRNAADRLYLALEKPEVEPAVWRWGYESYLKKGEFVWHGYTSKRCVRTDNFDSVVWQPLYGGKVEKQK
jgi:hypothetical protein